MFHVRGSESGAAVQNCRPDGKQPVEGPGGIGRTGRGKADRFSTDLRENVRPVKAEGGLTVGIDAVEFDKMVDAIKIELGERKMKFLEGNKAALVAGMEAAKA